MSGAAAPDVTRPGVRDVRSGFVTLCHAVAAAAGTDGPHESIALQHDLWQQGAPNAAAVRRVRLHDPADIAPCLLVPGLLADAVRPVVAPMATARRALAPHGYRLRVAWVNGRSGSDANARLLRRHVLDAASGHGEPLHLIGYSKGCTDALHLLANHPDTHQAIRSLTSLSGVVHGTPLAADTPEPLERLLRWAPLPGRGAGDGRAVDDLEPSARAAHLAAHPLPDGIRCASVAGAPEPARVSRILRPGHRRLARTDPHNDGQVVARDALLPHGDLLAVLNADHWAIALPIVDAGTAWRRWLGRWLVTRNGCARETLLAAILQYQQDGDVPGSTPGPCRTAT